MSADTAADDLVTEEMLEAAGRAYAEATYRPLAAAIRAVAPLIAERVAEVWTSTGTLPRTSAHAGRAGHEGR
jgi:hypothetical protein